MAGGYTENAAAALVRANYSDADLLSELFARILLGNITIPVSGGGGGGGGSSPGTVLWVQAGVAYSANQSMDSGWVSILGYRTLTAIVNTTKDGNNNGLRALEIQFSVDGVTVDRNLGIDILQNDPVFGGESCVVPPQAQYVKFKYTNGNQAATVRLQVIGWDTALGNKSVPLTDTLTRESLAQLTRTVLTGEEANNTYTNVRVDNQGRISTSIAASVPLTVTDGGLVNTSVPTPTAAGQRVSAWYDVFGRPNMALHSAELNSSIAHTSLRDLQVAQRYTVLSDSVADGFAAFWTLSSAGSGTNPAVASGEGTLAPGAVSGGVSQMTSTPVRYFPGQSSWLNSAIRLEAGVTGNTRRFGPVTMSGTTPQDGFYFELADTTLYAVVVKAGSIVSRVDSTAWTRASVSPFTLDTNYHSYEVRYTANGVQFYVDNVVRHVFSGTNTAITASLDFPITLQSINTGAIGTSGNLYIRNIGIGRFGTPPQDYTSGETRPDQAGAGAVLTFTFAIPVDFVWVTDTGTTTTNVSRVDAYGGTPSATQGSVVFNQVPTPIQVPSPTNTIKVYAPTGAIISMTGQRYV